MSDNLSPLPLAGEVAVSAAGEGPCREFVGGGRHHKNPHPALKGRPLPEGEVTPRQILIVRFLLGLCTDHSCFSKLQRPKLIVWNLQLLQSLFEIVNRLVNALVGQLKCSEMNAHALLTIQVDVGLDSIARIHVNIAHEPARFIGSDE